MLLFPVPYPGFPETLFLNEFSDMARKFSESIESAFEVLYEAACNQAGKSDSSQVFIEFEYPGAGHQVLRTSAFWPYVRSRSSMKWQGRAILP